jgi:hypothetical protein
MGDAGPDMDEGGDAGLTTAAMDILLEVAAYDTRGAGRRAPPSAGQVERSAGFMGSFLALKAGNLAAEVVVGGDAAVGEVSVMREGI